MSEPTTAEIREVYEQTVFDVVERHGEGAVIYFSHIRHIGILLDRLESAEATIKRQQTALDAVRKFRSDMRNLASVPQPESERARGFDAAHRLFDKAIREALAKADGGDV